MKTITRTLLPLLSLLPAAATAAENPLAGISAAASAGKADACAEKWVKGTELLVALEGGGAVTLDPKSCAIQKRFDTGPDAFGALYSPDGQRAFVTDKKNGTLSEIDVATGAVRATIPVGATPQQPAMTADGRIYIPLSGGSAIAVVDARSGLSSLRTVPIGDGTKPHIVSLSPDGKTLWATVQGRDPKVVSIEITADGEGALKEYRYDLVPRVVYATNEGAYFTAHHSTGVHHVSLADGKVTTPFVDASGPHSEPRKQIEGIVASDDGRLFGYTHEGRKAMTFVKRDASGRARKVFEAKNLSSQPYWVSVDPSGKVAYVSIPGSGTVEAYAMAGACKGTKLWTATVGAKPKRMAVTGAPRAAQAGEVAGCNVGRTESTAVAAATGAASSASGGVGQTR